MREIYNTKIIGSIDQGTIINSCVAEGYIQFSIFGIVITPRCDLDNNKVSTVHYLPVVRLEDWIIIDFWILFCNRVRNEIYGKIYGILDKYDLSRSLIQSISYTKLREALKEKISKPDDYDKFIKLLSELELLSKKHQEIKNDQHKQLLELYHKVSKSIFKDLKENKIKEFYLLESWDIKDNYYIVLMREIRKLNFDLANKVSFGLHRHQITVNEFKTNDISNESNQDEFICSIATLKSPHIEHLIQQFFWNFGRIGVENHPNDLENQFHNKIINLIS